MRVKRKIVLGRFGRHPRRCRRSAFASGLYVPQSLTSILVSICVVAVSASVAIPARAQEDTCLSKLYAEHTPSEADYLFDVAFDRNFQGKSFSCEILATASEARSTLEDFRFGYLYNSEEHIERSIRFPLTVARFKTRKSTEEGERVTVRNFEEWMTIKQQWFDGLQAAFISCANVRSVRIYKNRGFAIRNGMVWFTGEDVKVGPISLMPVTEEELVAECAGTR